MNKFILSLVACLFALNISGFAQGGENLSPAGFYNATKNNTRIQLIDVRTPGEFNGGHINNAENIDVNDRKFAEEIETLDKNKPTYVYCMSGGRSSNAMQQMLDAGFTKVYNLEGGILAWRKSKLPTSDKDNTVANGLTMVEFKKMVSGKTTVLVDFTATWCGPCKVLKPRIEQLENESKGNLKVIYIDVDKNKALSDELGIKSIPLLYVYKNGRLLRQSTGLVSSNELKRLIR